MKQLVGILVVFLLLTSACATKQQRIKSRALKHFNKAVALDPTLYKTSTKIKDSTRVTDSTRIKDSIQITRKTEFTATLGNPCDSLTGKPKFFDYTFGAGPTKARIWLDEKGLRYTSSTDSLVQRISSLEKTKIEYRDKVQEDKGTLTITEYKTDWWQLITAGVIGAVTAFLFMFLKKLFLI